MYLVKNPAFHFPSDDTPVIMIGPGTGIAPFRAYLQEIEASKQKNDTWLFFGHQYKHTDFLYQTEIEQWLSRGVLNKADFAWSRDQKHKVYVQHKIQAHQEEVWSWIQRGAIIYVCGDASRMAKDVEQTFIDIAEFHGVPDGKTWLTTQKTKGLYRTDVY